MPTFLDPTELGKFHRQTIFPRFRAYVDNDVTYSGLGDHWLNSTNGAYKATIDIQGVTLGIVGVNTAWLSFSNDDRHNLSAGKSLLEDGLESIKSCDIKIVLGHHPVDWFLDTDLEPVRALLSRYTVLYLHGHMHKPLGKYTEGAGYPFLALQSGASFQAREDEAWVNRFLWCELDLTTREISIEPLQWSKSNQNWVTDGGAFPPGCQQGNRWILSLPSPVPHQPIVKKIPLANKSQLEVPDGWNIVDAQDLKNRHKELSSKQAISFFDGRTPSWREALAPQIYRRDMVATLVNTLETARQDGGLHITLLIGAAGEGKTTVLLQTVCDLVASGADWHILYRHDPEAPLPAEFLSRLPDSGTWLIVSDDAEVIARRVYDSIRALKENERKNIQFFLCCRDTDWKAVDGDSFPWGEYAKYVTESLRGLTKNDAKKVIDSWSLYGRDGLKTLDGMQYDDAANRLFLAAKSEEINNGDGSFFGAVLQVRWGEGLKKHIDSLLEKLEKRSINSERNLLDAFAYIAAMHAENIQLLSRDVLAEVLEMSTKDLRKKVLNPLGDEAAIIATTGHFVFTRHNAIARLAIKTLSEKYDYDLEDIYLELVQTALGFKDSDTFIPNFGEWGFLSSLFFDKGNQILGIRLAEVALQADPNSHHFIVKLSQLYRKAEQPEKSVLLFRSKPYIESKDRYYFYEWATAEGSIGRHALSVCLAALALADETIPRPPSNDDAKFTFTGLCIAFSELYSQFNLSIFNSASGAAALLGLTLKLDSIERPRLQSSLTRAKYEGFQDVTSQEALEIIHQGVLTAWKQMESKLPEWVMADNKFSFTGLARLLRIV